MVLVRKWAQRQQRTCPESNKSARQGKVPDPFSQTLAWESGGSGPSFCLCHPQNVIVDAASPFLCKRVMPVPTS